MHIIQLIICGFKSYKEKTVIDDFDPRFNIIVGRNGSGKSNLFAAIEFALTLEYRNMRPEARSALLHNGRAPHEPAYVEIEFDNTDRKLSLNEDIVTFRRTIATKADKFSVNGKELKNARQFLDMAGFTNPYFIVKQGKIQQLAVSNNQFRLKLLQDVAGSSTYDDKIKECHKSLRDGATKKEDVGKSLERLKERQKALEKEAGELTEFVKLDQSRRAIEFILNEREQVSERKRIDECTAARETLTEKMAPLQKNSKEAHAQIEAAKESLSVVQRKIQLVKDKKELVDADILMMIKEKQKLENLLQDATNNFDSEITKNMTTEMHKISRDIGMVENELEKAKKRFEKVKKQEKELNETLIKTESELKSLESKLQDGNQSETAKQKKVRVKKLLIASSEDYNTKNKILDNSKQELAKLKEEKKTIASKLEVKRKQFEVTNNELQKLERTTGYQEEMFTSQKARSDFWRSLNEVEHKLSTEKEIRQTIFEHLYKRVGRPSMNGWDGVNKVMQKFADDEDDIVDGYYGLLVENITAIEDLDTAIESATGNKLFHHIVQNGHVGMKIMKEFNKQSFRGEVSFLPLEEVFVRDGIDSQSFDDLRNCKHLLKQITFRPEVKKAVEFVFGQYLVCATLGDATAAARTHKINCVTLDGDKVSKSGPITGGYMQATVGQLELLRGKQACDEKIEKLTKKKAELEETLALLESTLKDAAKQHEVIESKKFSLRAEKDRLGCDIKVGQERLKNCDLSITQTNKALEAHVQSAFELKCKMDNLEKDMSNLDKSSSQLSQSESQLEKGFRVLAQELKKEIKRLLQNKLKVTADRTTRECEMNAEKQKLHNLNSTLDEHKLKIVEQSSSQEQHQRLSKLESNVEYLTQQIKTKEHEADQINNQIPQMSQELAKCKKLVERCRDKETEANAVMFKLSRDLETLSTDYIGCQTRLQNLADCCHNLGSIPAGTNKYERKDSKTLYNKLKKLNVSLKDKDDVNQKAAEQFRELNEKYTIFHQSLIDLETERDDLDKLIDDLERKKNEALLKNFKVLQEQFSEIFSKVVPKGHAELVLLGDKGLEITHKNIADKILTVSEKEHLTGLQIEANFVSRKSKQRELISLSGGQKSVVALALILAIQKIDPVPFYLFDEVDQALDPQYRSAVTKVIYEMATQFNLQFVCTTFRREFLTKAHKFYGVSYHNKVSYVKAVTVEEAFDFVEEEGVLSLSVSSSDSLMA